jgi:hypothetical protein
MTEENIMAFLFTVLQPHVIGDAPSCLGDKLVVILATVYSQPKLASSGCRIGQEVVEIELPTMFSCYADFGSKACR